MVYMVTWIPSLYPQCIPMLAFIYQHHGSVMGDIKTLEICGPTLEVQNCLRPAAQVCRASLERNLPTVAAELPAPWGELKTWLDACP
jgi:hypothetical protein